ncbi:MAG: response regulator [Oscillospiraceae bacterium]|nr:response regulator [Oscillospiraceae bacterium]MCR5304887.1 response regulator [Oscillospiraceae bacterium]
MKRVLVCEDEDVIRGFVIINLRRAGYDVTDVNCGEDALRAYDEAEGNFDIAVLDIMMPGLDGIEVCKALREKSESLGIILLTAKAQEADREEGLQSGADDYVTKPFSPSELIKRVSDLCRRKSAGN